MANVAFTKTQISNKRFVVEWSGINDGDTCEPFEAVDAELESAIGSGFAPNLGGLRQSNAASPGNWTTAPFAFNNLPNHKSCRWYSVDVPFQMSNGSVRLLFREI